jgi:hypothetical protein
MHWEDRFRQKAADQEGLVGRFQLPAMGCTINHWWNAKRNGRWLAPSSRVIALRGVPASEAQRVHAALLDTGPGSILHGASTLSWLGLQGFDQRTIHVARPWGLRSAPSELATIHRLRAIRAHDVIVVRGVVTETALRAIWCEAARYSSPDRIDYGAEKFGRLLDNAHKLKLVTWAGLAEMVDDIHERGRAGTTIMRALSEARPPGSSPTESRNEDQLEKILANAGVDPLERQIVVGGHEPIGRSDHRDPRRPLAVEVNSLLHHTAPSDRLADERRYEALNVADFTVGVIWEDDIWSHPHQVVRTVAIARRLAAAGERVVVHSPSCPWPDLLPTHRLA